ncbi:MAG: hypothetical protein IJ675_05280 [Pseudobutyrivibrio sp.]|nr:hypothetical protein [Pseudobutyrivibrio sp.]
MAEVIERETERETTVSMVECRYCGQMHSVEHVVGLSQEELVTMATSMCDCDEAIGETKRLEGVALAEKNIEKLLGKYAFVKLLKPFADALAKQYLDSVTVKVDNVTATMSCNDKGKIILKKKVALEDTLEA